MSAYVLEVGVEVFDLAASIQIERTGGRRTRIIILTCLQNRLCVMAECYSKIKKPKASSV